MAAGKERKAPVRRSVEERVADIDSAIKFHEEKIKALQAKKEKILHPPQRKSKAAGMKALIAKAKEAGLTNEEIAEKLGINLNDE